MIRRFIASLLILSLAGLGFTAPAQAAMVATDAAVASTERGRISSLLERAEVRAQLQAYGVDAADVKARVAALTDEEAAQVAAQLDSLKVPRESWTRLVTHARNDVSLHSRSTSMKAGSGVRASAYRLDAHAASRAKESPVRPKASRRSRCRPACPPTGC